MSALLQGWDRYWFKPSSLFNLAVVRIVLVTYQIGYLIYNARGVYYERFQDLSNLPDEIYHPLPILRPFLWFFSEGDSWYRFSYENQLVIFYISVFVGLLALVGFVTNFSLAAFAVGNIVLHAYVYSFVEFHHPESIMMVALCLLAISPSGAVLSADHRLRLRRNGQPRPSLADLLDASSRYAGWPLLLTRWVYGLIYLSAGLHKFAAGGGDWVNGYTLQYYMLRDATIRGMPAGVFLGGVHWLIVVMSILTIVWELTFFLAVIFPKLALIYVPLGIGFHLGTALTMKARFFPFILTYVVFVPWDRVVLWFAARTSGRKRQPLTLSKRNT